MNTHLNFILSTDSGSDVCKNAMASMQEVCCHSHVLHQKDSSVQDVWVRSHFEISLKKEDGGGGG